MEEINASSIFWLCTLGFTIGFIMRLILGREGAGMAANIIWGVIGSVSMGSVFMILEISGAMLFAFISTLAMLFVVNVFHQHHVEDVFGHVDRELSIKEKKHN